jgi:hypothetical protein
MSEPRVVLILLVLMSFGLSLAVPAEDVRETAYDESEALPYECTPLFSIVLLPAAAPTTHTVLNFLHGKSGNPPRPPFCTCPRGTDTRRPAGRTLAVLLCIRLC